MLAKLTTMNATPRLIHILHGLFDDTNAHQGSRQCAEVVQQMEGLVQFDGDTTSIVHVRVGVSEIF